MTPAVLGLLVVAACSTPQAPAAAPAAPPSTGPAATTSSAPSPTPPPPLPGAADGDDLDACRDGTCEVRVTAGSKIPYPRRAEVTAEVRTIGEGRMQLTGSWPGGSASNVGDCDTCSARVTMPGRDSAGAFEVQLAAGAGIQINEYVLEVVALGRDAAVVRLHEA